jgi:hypothetical protein
MPDQYALNASGFCVPGDGFAVFIGFSGFSGFKPACMAIVFLFQSNQQLNGLTYSQRA